MKLFGASIVLLVFADLSFQIVLYNSFLVLKL